MEDFKLIGIDSKLVDRIYFPKQEDKVEYLSRIQSTLTALSISIGDERMNVINKISQSNVEVEFLREVLAYTGDIQYSKNSERNNYYTNCKLCEYNLAKKLAAGVTNFQDDELLFRSIMEIDLVGYAKAIIIFKMGQTFSTIGDWEKADSYFDLFKNTSFILSPVTVSGFYRAIGEIYMEADKKEASLNWFKAGLRINPKLGVKKKLKKLESI